jgi:hypothetical protein
VLKNPALHAAGKQPELRRERRIEIDLREFVVSVLSSNPIEKHPFENDAGLRLDPNLLHEVSYVLRKGMRLHLVC